MKALIIDDDPDILEVVSLCFEIRWPDATILRAADGASGAVWSFGGTGTAATTSGAFGVASAGGCVSGVGVVSGRTSGTAAAGG